MTPSEYKKVKPGDTVISLQSMHSRVMEIPAGTELTVLSKRNGFNVSAPACEHCGVRVFMQKVDAWLVRLP